MLRARLTATGNGLNYGKLAFALLIAIGFCMIHPASTAYAKNKKKKSNTGTIKVRTAPAGLPLSIDGKPEGQTSTDYMEYTLEPGLHKLVITLPSGEQWARDINVAARRRTCVDLNYRPPVVVTKSPCPYPVNVSAPPTVSEGDLITFTADVAYSGTSALRYTWSVTPNEAKIVNGMGTPTLTVDSTGLGGKKVTAVLVVDDGSGDSMCRQEAQASTMIPQPPPPRESPSREFDVCCSCSYDDQKARLDNLGIELQNDPSTTSYIIAYSGRTSHTGQAERLLARAKDYLVGKRGVDPARLVTLNGGYREEDCVELWIVPQGATPPQATPTVQAGEARPAAGKPASKKRTRH
ncbi:MAG: PEGA domain-containing protein [Acidobacteriota bacterium]|nr:PEGA domain-containing protein [Acidobacteriota bacterium]